jgi:hypothetical protein
VNNYISGSDVSVSPLINTTYTLTNVTDINGCVSVAVSGSTLITVNLVPVAPGVTFVPNYCVDATIVAPIITTPTGSSVYTWYSDALLMNVLTTGTAPSNLDLGFSSAAPNTTDVFVAETNSSNCEGPVTQITLTVNPNPVAPDVTFTSTYCVGTAITPPIITTPWEEIPIIGIVILVFQRWLLQVHHPPIFNLALAVYRQT